MWSDGILILRKLVRVYDLIVYREAQPRHFENNPPLKRSFFGGGTPLLLPPRLVAKVLDSAIADFPDFESVKVEIPNWSQVPTDKDEENLLQKSEIMFFNQIQGRKVAFDPKGHGPYTGIAVGRVVFWDGQNFLLIEICDQKPTIFGYLKMSIYVEDPWGCVLIRKQEYVHISDAYFGLLKVGPEGRLATPLATEAEGVPLKSINDLDLKQDGNIYFTYSSTKYQRRPGYSVLIDNMKRKKNTKLDDDATRQANTTDHWEFMFDNSRKLSVKGLSLTSPPTPTAPWSPKSWLEQASSNQIQYFPGGSTIEGRPKI
nr:protein strictosidine synthase-like 3 [Tanacetum cinerariifolium]